MFTRFDCILSLGSSCVPKRYISKCIAPCETDVFDYIGTPYMWSVNSLIESRWASITDPDTLKFLPLYKFNIFRMMVSLVTNTRHYIQFAHDAPRLRDITPEFHAKIKRRTERFDAKMRESKSVLFIRIKGDVSPTSYPKYNMHIIEPLIRGHPKEEEAMEQFIPLIKSVYGTPSVTMIYLNDEQDGWNADKTILSVKCDINMDYKTAHTTIDDLFKKKGVYRLIQGAGTSQTHDPTV